MLFLLLVAALQTAPEILTHDLDWFPIPNNAKLDEEKTKDFSRNQAEMGQFKDNADVRARVYNVASTAAEVAAFYKTKFPDFVLGKPQKSDKNDKIEIAMYAYAFRSTASGWELVTPIPQDQKEGLVLIVTEIHDGGDPHCLMIVATLRKV